MLSRQSAPTTYRDSRARTTHVPRTPEVVYRTSGVTVVGASTAAVAVWRYNRYFGAFYAVTLVDGTFRRQFRSVPVMLS